jgi:phosphopantothenoylcysteine decarboxylase/phosphopantothenate--cysteine ligase
VVGFALETGSGLRRARAKLARKGADYIVLNDPTALNAERTSVTIIARDGDTEHIVNRTKETVAEALVGLMAST